MIHGGISPRTRLLLGIASMALLAVSYLALSARQHARNPNDTTLPNLGQLAEGVSKVVTRNEADDEVWLFADMKATFYRLFTGLLVGCLASVVLGILMGCYPKVEAFFFPGLSFLAKIPPTAMLAVFFVIAGTGFKLYVTMIAFGVLPTLTQTVYQSAKKDVPDELIFKASTLGASQFEVIWDVIFQQTLPKMLDAIRLQIGPAMVYLIAAELMSADVGFGYRLRMESRLLHMNVVYVYLVVLGAAGYLLDTLMIRLRRRLCPWYGQ